MFTQPGLTFEDVLLLTIAIGALSIIGIFFGTIIYLFNKGEDRDDYRY